MEFTRPLEAIMHKFDFIEDRLGFSMLRQENSEESSTSLVTKSDTSAKEFVENMVQLWHETVEVENPGFFNLTEEEIKSSSNTLDYETASKDTKKAQLYDTSLDYLLLLIQRSAHLESSETQDRDEIYDIFQSVKPKIGERIDDAIDYNNHSNIKDNVVALTNVKRNVNYHFESENVKELIISANLEEDYAKVHEITRIPLYIHMVAAIICLSFSSVFHLFT
jgi:hypothetical protein